MEVDLVPFIGENWAFQNELALAGNSRDLLQGFLGEIDEVEVFFLQLEGLVFELCVVHEVTKEDVRHLSGHLEVFEGLLESVHLFVAKLR